MNLKRTGLVAITTTLKTAVKIVADIGCVFALTESTVVKSATGVQKKNDLLASRYNKEIAGAKRPAD